MLELLIYAICIYLIIILLQILFKPLIAILVIFITLFFCSDVNAWNLPTKFETMPATFNNDGSNIWPIEMPVFLI